MTKEYETKKLLFIGNTLYICTGETVEEITVKDLRTRKGCLYINERYCLTDEGTFCYEGLNKRYKVFTDRRKALILSNKNILDNRIKDINHSLAVIKGHRTTIMTTEFKLDKLEKELRVLENKKEKEDGK